MIRPGRIRMNGGPKTSLGPFGGQYRLGKTRAKRLKKGWISRRGLRRDCRRAGFCKGDGVMTQLKLEISKSDLASVKRMLSGVKAAIPRVIQQSVNRTLSGVRTDATNEVAKVITPTKKKIRSTMTIKKMTAADGSAFVRCTGGPLNLINFKARPTNKGVTVPG